MAINRRLKYPDTDTFTFYNANTHNRYTTDCVPRAIATALDLPYGETVMELARLQCQTGYDKGDEKLYGLFLEKNGFKKCKQPRKKNNKRYSGKEFCKELANGRRIFAHIGTRHVVAIVDNKVFDTWDCTENSVGVYWAKG